MEIPNRIEFISYTSEYHDQVIDVLREFFQLETVCISTGINKNLEAQRDLEKFSSEIMEKANINVIAKDVDTNKVVGAALNLIQVDNAVACKSSILNHRYFDYRSMNNQHRILKFFAMKSVEARTQKV